MDLDTVAEHTRGPVDSSAMHVGLALNQGHEHIEIEDTGALLRDAEILERLG